MGRYIIRRILVAIPTLLVISFVIFAILDLAPNDPTGNLPMTIPPEVREQIRQSLGLGQPFYVRLLWSTSPLVCSSTSSAYCRHAGAACLSRVLPLDTLVMSVLSVVSCMAHISIC